VTMMGDILSADPARLEAIARDETEALARRHEIVG